MEKSDTLIASILTLVAALIQLTDATRGKAATSDGVGEAFSLYTKIFARLKKDIPRS